jgi:hypothetical protein
VKETSRLVLHMKDLDLDNTTLRITSSSDKQFLVAEKLTWTYDSVTHFLIVELKSPFKDSHNYTFSAEYKGYTKYDELGLYRSFYWNSNNTKRLFTKNLVSQI